MSARHVYQVEIVTAGGRAASVSWTAASEGKARRAVLRQYPGARVLHVFRVDARPAAVTP